MRKIVTMKNLVRSIVLAALLVNCTHIEARPQDSPTNQEPPPSEDEADWPDMESEDTQKRFVVLDPPRFGGQQPQQQGNFMRWGLQPNRRPNLPWQTSPRTPTTFNHNPRFNNNHRQQSFQNTSPFESEVRGEGYHSRIRLDPFRSGLQPNTGQQRPIGQTFGNWPSRPPIGTFPEAVTHHPKINPFQNSGEFLSSAENSRLPPFNDNPFPTEQRPPNGLVNEGRPRPIFHNPRNRNPPFGPSTYRPPITRPFLNPGNLAALIDSESEFAQSPLEYPNVEEAAPDIDYPIVPNVFDDTPTFETKSESPIQRHEGQHNTQGSDTKFETFPSGENQEENVSFTDQGAVSRRPLPDEETSSNDKNGKQISNKNGTMEDSHPTDYNGDYYDLYDEFMEMYYDADGFDYSDYDSNQPPGFPQPMDNSSSVESPISNTTDITSFDLSTHSTTLGETTETTHYTSSISPTTENLSYVSSISTQPKISTTHAPSTTISDTSETSSATSPLSVIPITEITGTTTSNRLPIISISTPKTISTPDITTELRTSERTTTTTELTPVTPTTITSSTTTTTTTTTGVTKKTTSSMKSTIQTTSPKSDTVLPDSSTSKISTESQVNGGLRKTGLTRGGQKLPQEESDQSQDNRGTSSSLPNRRRQGNKRGSRPISLVEILQGIGMSLPQFLVSLKGHGMSLKEFTVSLQEKRLTQNQFKRAEGDLDALLSMLETGSTEISSTKSESTTPGTTTTLSVISTTSKTTSTTTKATTSTTTIPTTSATSKTTASSTTPPPRTTSSILTTSSIQTSTLGPRIFGFRQNVPVNKIKGSQNVTQEENDQLSEELKSKAPIPIKLDIAGIMKDKGLSASDILHDLGSIFTFGNDNGTPKTSEHEDGKNIQTDDNQDIKDAEQNSTTEVQESTTTTTTEAYDVPNEPVSLRPYRPSGGSGGRRYGGSRGWGASVHGNRNIMTNRFQTTKRTTLRPPYKPRPPKPNDDISPLLNVLHNSTTTAEGGSLSFGLPDDNKLSVNPQPDNAPPRYSSENYYPIFDDDPNSLNVSTKSAILAASILGGVAMCVFLAILVVVMYRGRTRRRKPLTLHSDSSSSSTPPIYSSRIGSSKSHYKTSGFWGTLKKRFDPYSLSPTPTVMT